MLEIHKASAGSGKTFTLTRNYIKLLLGEKTPAGYRLSSGANRHRAILAITFTNKATEEMKARIVKQLGLLADPDGKSPYRKYLCDEFQCTPAALSDHARKALNSLLADFGNFNISTIDAFFQTVLRTFAREANLSGNYEVELDTKQAVYLGVNAMLSSLNAGTGEPAQRRRLQNWLKQYMQQRLDEGKAFNLFVRNSHITTELVKYIERSLNESYKLNIEAISAYLSEPERIVRFADSIKKAIVIKRKHLHNQAKDAKEILESNGVLAGVNRYVKGPLEKWADGDINVKKPLSATVRNTVDDPLKSFTKNYQNTPGDLVKTLGSIARLAVQTWEELSLLTTLRDNIFHLGIIGAVERHTAEIQTDNNAILLSDTGSILQTIINQEEAPFIYERLGVHLRHFLIDEFQDTSRLQWLNISPLVKESLATDNDNLIIGDEKQAIYRFRNSDPSLIIKDVPEEFASVCQLHGNVITENTNWRSAADIVRFNNTLFIAMARQLGLSDIYANVVQGVAKSKIKGYIEAEPFSDPEESLQRMVTHIERQLAMGYNQKDIAVLCARNSECAQVVERLLEAGRPDAPGGGIPNLQIITDEALIVGNASSVRQIIGVMRYVDAHVSLQRRTGATPTPPEIVNRFEFFLAMGSTPSEAIAKAFEPEGAEADQTALAAAEMQCINVPSIVERIITRCLNDEIRANENLYITAFQDMVIDFCSRGNADLHSFIKWWDEKGSSRSLSVPEGIDGIRVMTIHKSKGLEFPCVHIPLLSGSLSSPDNMMWVSLFNADGTPLDLLRTTGFNSDDIPPLLPLTASAVGKISLFKEQYDEAVHDERVDRLNQVYVAFTRASRELIIGYKDESSEVSTLLENAFNEMTPEMVSSVSRDRNLPLDVLIPLSDKLVKRPIDTPSPPSADEADNSDESDQSDQTGKSSKKKASKERPADRDVFILGEPRYNPDDNGDDDTPQIIPMPPYYSYDNGHIWDTSRIEDVEEIARPRLRGIVLHTIMGYVRHRDDLHRAVLRAAMRGIITFGEIDEIEAILTRALDDPRVAPWFDGYRRLLRERTVTIPAKPTYERPDERTRHYRPDRVVWTADGTIDIIDYKFGEEESNRYLKQVRGYMHLIRRIHPDTRVRGFLWYPLTDTIIPVTPK